MSHSPVASPPPHRPFDFAAWLPDRRSALWVLGAFVLGLVLFLLVWRSGRDSDDFYRADPARARRTGGSGLGLSIVKHAVQRHGGEVRLWSRPGRGSTFTIRLPEIAPPADQADPKRGRRKTKKRSRAEASRPLSTNGEPV